MSGFDDLVHLIDDPINSPPVKSVQNAQKPTRRLKLGKRALTSIQLTSNSTSFTTSTLKKPNYIINEPKQQPLVESSSSVQTFTVLLGKPSKKKHKTYEEDAFMIYDPKTNLCSLKMSLNKAQFSSFQAEKTPEPGDELIGGGKLVQVVDLVTKLNDTGINSTSEQHAPSTSLPHVAKRTLSRSSSSLVTPVSSKETTSNPSVLSLKYREICVPIDQRLAKSLHEYQFAGVTFMFDVLTRCDSNGGHGVILADEMGLGKSLQCLTLFWTLLKSNLFDVKRALVICPLSVVGNWEKELTKWFGSHRLKSITIRSASDNVAALLRNSLNVDLVVSTYETASKFSAEFSGHGRFNLVFCDEGHKLKNSQSSLYVNIRSIISSDSCRNRCVIMSGTPVQNNVTEFLALLRFANPSLEVSKSDISEVYDLYVLRRTKQSIVDAGSGDKKTRLPPITIFTLFCKATQLQNRLTDAVCKYVNENTGDGATEESGSYPLQLSCINLLRRIASAPELIKNVPDSLPHYLLQNIKTISDEFDCSNQLSSKLNVMLKLLDWMFEENEKVVVLSHYTYVLDHIEKSIQRRNGNKLSLFRIDGSTSGDKRSTFVRQFQSFSPAIDRRIVLLLSAKAGGVGIDLTSARYVIQFDLDWNPAHDEQSLARVHRQTQRRPTFVFRLLTTGTIDEKIFQRQLSKSCIQTEILDAASNSSNHPFNHKEFRALFRGVASSDCDTHDLLGCPRCGGNSEICTAGEFLSKDAIGKLLDDDTAHLKATDLAGTHDVFAKASPNEPISDYVSFCFQTMFH